MKENQEALEEPLSFHITSKADITVMVCRLKEGEERIQETVYGISEKGIVQDIRLAQKAVVSDCIGTNIWITGKEFLLNMIQEAAAYSHSDIEKDIFQKNLGRYKLAAWEYKGYLWKINSLCDYFKANMDILQPGARHELFYSYGPVYTKMTDEIPARYGNSAYGSHSLIADGCIIEGQVENCILFRGVTIGKGAVVKNSILMNNTKVGENAILNYIITDKQVHLSEGRTLVGCIEQPAYVRKGSRI